MKINIRSAVVGLCGAAFALAVAAGTASATTVPTWGQPHLPGDQILQVSKQGNSISQTATATAKSTQFLPTNVNVAPSLFSVGSNDGGVKQGNVSSANANAQNNNHSFQGNGVVQAVQPVKGTPGSPSRNWWGQQGGKNHGQGNPCQPKRQPKPYGPQGPGPQGPQGPHGPQGPQGPQGPRVLKVPRVQGLRVQGLRVQDLRVRVRARRRALLRATASGSRPAPRRRARSSCRPTSTLRLRSSASAPTTAA